MKRFIFFILLAFFYSFTLLCKNNACTILPQYTIQHYTLKDGLGYGLVNDILQDHKGLLWFASWNGLNRFDGFSFKNFKANINSKIEFTNNRILSIKEDSIGFLWILCYDNSIYRFDPHDESFTPITIDKTSIHTLPTINVLKNGIVWLINENFAIRGESQRKDRNLKLTHFTNQQFGKINQILQDNDTQEWILSEKGLFIYNPQTQAIKSMTIPNLTNPQFYTGMEDRNTILLGCNNGNICKYNKKDRSFSLLQLATEANIIDIKRLNHQEILYLTDSDGFFIEDSLRIRHISKASNPELIDNHMNNLFIDRCGLIWMGHSTLGISMFNPQTQSFTYFLMYDEYGKPLATETGQFIFEDRNDILWVHPKGGGLSYYDRDKNQLISFNPAQKKHEWKSNDRCFCATVDRQGNLWISTLLGGLNKITFQHQFFHLFPIDIHDKESAQNEIRALFVDQNQRTWVGNRNMNILIYDKDKQYVGQLSRSGQITKEKNSNNKLGKVYNITQDRSGDYWIATKGQGIYHLHPVSDTEFQIKQYTHNPNDPYSLSCNNVYNIFQDRNDRIWIATYGGGLNLIDHSDHKLRFIHHQNEMKNYPIEKYYKLRHITEDTQGMIWVSTTAGILVFNSSFTHPANIQYAEHYQLSEKTNTITLSNRDVYMVSCLKNGRIFAATFGEGLEELIDFKFPQAIFRPYSKEEGLMADIIYSIQPDDKNNLWLATGKGLIKFSLTENTFEHYGNDLLAFNAQFSEGSTTFDSQQIQIGTTKGIFYFNPKDVSKNTFVPPIYFSTLSIDNKVITPNDSSGILKKALNESEQIEIPHKAHTISIKYSALDMTNAENTQYAYMLEGYDKTFHFVNNDREAVYTDLPKGNYIFRVKSTNSEGVWGDNEKTLHIKVQPLFWETPYAWILYLCVTAGILWITFHFYTTIHKLKYKTQREELVAQFKFTFFKNICHELRTPLTLISNPLEHLLTKGNMTNDLREELSIAKRYSDRILRLVNQLLDFNQIRDHKMKLYVQRLDIISFLREIIRNFQILTEKHDIKLTFKYPPNTQIFIWCDSSKIENAIYNLLSNAFKFTPPLYKKAIHLDLYECDNFVIIDIVDEGAGISTDKQKKLFNRFENSLHANFIKRPDTDIGLAITKEFIELHKGKIQVKSELGKGTCFKIMLPTGKTHFPQNTEFILTDFQPALVESHSYSPIHEESTFEGEYANRILIVENNKDLRTFIKEVFKDEFQVIEASNGEEGLEYAKSYIPDIIISEIMMPQKDGLQMLHELREDINISHIPIIILTAKADIELKIKGLEFGADAYILKPFNFSYLQARVNNLLSQRKMLQLYYSNRTNYSTNQTATCILSQKDNEFLQKLSEIIEQEISNPELSVELLVEHFNFGRTIFFRKLKSLTGKSPINYIKEARMNKAVQLLKERQYNISEIAYKVGFSDPQYFSKSFKQYYGISPSKYQP